MELKSSIIIKASPATKGIVTEVYEQAAGETAEAASDHVEEENRPDADAAAADDNDDDGKIKPPNCNKPLCKIELVMDKLEKRRERRMEVTWKVRKSFIDICKERVTQIEGRQLNAIPFHELVRMQEEYADAPGLSEVFQAAVKSCAEVKADTFYFRDFNEYRLTLKKNLLARNPLLGSLVGVLTFYFFSTIVFCGFMGNNSTCPKSEGGVPGWVTTLYFISTTISTVGYGDISVVASGYEGWRVFVGTLFMILSMVVAVTVFSQLAGTVVNATQGVASPWMAPLFKQFTDIADTKPLWYQLRTVKMIRLFELSLYFVLLNLFGTFMARLIFLAGKEDVDWSWTTTFYWSVQTTTTIGYGDLTMPNNLRWFNLLFTVIGTAFAASLLGSLADLKNEIENIRKFYVWKNREVSMRLIADMEGDDDGQLDAYEFLIGSLITLDKIQREDVRVIMDKFRELAGEDEVITEEDIENHTVRRLLGPKHISQKDIEDFNAKMYPIAGTKTFWEEVELSS